MVVALTPFYSLLRTLQHDTPKQNMQVRGPLTALHVMAIMHISPVCITNSRHVLIFSFKCIFPFFGGEGESRGVQGLSYPVWH